jgi:hypothetical protein
MATGCGVLNYMWNLWYHIGGSGGRSLRTMLLSVVAARFVSAPARFLQIAQTTSFLYISAIQDSDMIRNKTCGTYCGALEQQLPQSRG